MVSAGSGVHLVDFETNRSLAGERLWWPGGCGLKEVQKLGTRQVHSTFFFFPRTRNTAFHERRPSYVRILDLEERQ